MLYPAYSLAGNAMPVSSPVVTEPFSTVTETEKKNLAMSPDKDPSWNAISIVVSDVLRAAQEMLESSKKSEPDDAARTNLRTMVDCLDASMGKLAINGKRNHPITSLADHADILTTLQLVDDIRKLTTHIPAIGAQIIPDVTSKKAALVPRADSYGRKQLASLMQDALTSSPAALGKKATGFAALGQHRQAALFSIAADIKQGTDDANPVYLIQTCKSLLAMGHATEAAEGLCIAAEQLARAPKTRNAAGLHKEIAALKLRADTAVYTGDSRSKEADNSSSPSDIGIDVHGTWLSTWIAKNSDDYDGIINDLAKIQHETATVRTESQQETIKSNRDLRDSRITQKLAAMKERTDAIAEQQAAAKKAGWFAKLTKYLGYAVTALCVVLGPFTCGLSLIAAGFMALDLGLELGEELSGIKMSLQSGITALTELVVEAVASSNTTPEGRKQCAAIIAMVLGFVVQIAVVVLTCGLAVYKSAGKVAKAANEATKIGTEVVEETAKGSAAVAKAGTPPMATTGEIGAKATQSVESTGRVATAVKSLKKLNKNISDIGTRKEFKYLAKLQPYATAATAGASIVGGVTAVMSGGFGIVSANKGAEVFSADMQRTEIENFQTRLDKYFQQYADDLKNLVQEQQRNLGSIGETLWSNIDDKIKNIEALFRHNHQKS